MESSISILESKIESIEKNLMIEERTLSDEEEAPMTEEEKLELKYNLKYHKSEMCRICLEVKKNEPLLPMNTYINIDGTIIRFVDCFKRLCPEMLDSQPWFPPNACQICVDRVIRSHVLVEELRIARNREE